MTRGGSASAGGVRRIGVRVEGTVQGVGFRPHVFRLASELGLSGWVRNDAAGVEVEVEGGAAALSTFVRRLAAERPALAVIEGVSTVERPVDGATGFVIAPSAAGAPAAPVAPDSATCPACLIELAAPEDRRYRYPFINCTNCGPRFTIVLGVPYDRPRTTMAGFSMCAACQAEYEDPLDRRFHAQPNACPACGPTARYVDAGGHDLCVDPAPGAASADGKEIADAVSAAAVALRAGAVVAVKGVGGYHLACRADDPVATARLRARKHREDKPFALMVADLPAARELVELEAEEEALLTGRERPIVLAPVRAQARVAAGVAPASRELGIMMPYSGLHHLLLDDVGTALVLTSGNLSDEPIAYHDADALKRLGPIADGFLTHDRPIHMRTDDSVVRAVAVAGRRAPMILRRSRGYVPSSIALPLDAPHQLLACGAELKSTFCLVKGSRAWVGHHIGDLQNWETLRSFQDGVEHFERLFAVTPRVVVCDLHPDYGSTAYALAREGVERLAVQHHHAHLAAGLAEHGELGPAVGAIYDGAGLGVDGTVWGGELLVGGLDDFRRAGHLRVVPLPGGDRAAREPWRMACAWLAAATDRLEPELPNALAGAVAPERWRTIAQLTRSGVASPPTSSVGRLCDAVAALAGGWATVSYEGQAAIEFEAVCDATERGAYPVAVSDGEQVEIDPRELVVAAASDAASGVAVGVIATRFHHGLADATARACSVIAAREGLGTVVLSGGVFQNRRLLERTAARLAEEGLGVLTPERLPPGDGGISYGQAAVAAARARHGSRAA